ncbi:FimV/HubP family polar landmark protein [Pararobbsia alpina]|uniref:LysM domain-containing protein n=1 Tax=Pararobbsia alpina TaxID=621374 RepID=A0A6S7B3N0_9BURK|nr:FimV/HubP family polar landmark protein [Pararobbsia alpina]CAB3785982.1 hypothetical protein LMG28138_02119 [Pararobbsia alpina]
MIVLDRLVRSLVAPPSWKSTVFTWSIAVLAAMSLNAQAQRPPASSHAAHAAEGSGGAAASEASNEPPMPDHYEVQKGQWLTDIAGELTHSNDPTVKQKMADALYAANPDAFFANDPNRLKIGAVLKVPHLHGRPASAVTASTSGSSKHAASGTSSVSSASVATAHASSTSAEASMPFTAAAAGASATADVMAAGASATPGAASVAGAPALTAAVASVAMIASASNEGGASDAASSTTASSSVPAITAAASDAASASATAVASGTRAWTGAIAPPPAPPPSASDASASGPAQSQNVSSLQQLLQLKNRVLAALQAHGLGPHASAPATTELTASSPSAAAPPAAARVTPRPQTGPLQGPLAIPALIVVLIVVALAIWICLPARRREPAANAAPPDLPLGTGGPHGDGTEESKDSVPAHPRLDDEAQTAAGAGVAIAGIAASAAYAAQAPSSGSQGDSAGEAESESEGEAGVDAEAQVKAEAEANAEVHKDIDEPDEGRQPQAEPPFSLEEGATGGLPTHDPQRRMFVEEARAPYDAGLLLGLLEMHAHRREVTRFEELANELWELTDGEGPDWQRAAGMGRGIDRDNPLYADDPYAAYQSAHDANKGVAKPLPEVDLDLPEVPSLEAATPVSDPAAVAPDPTRDDASRSSDATSSFLPEATPPAHVPVSEPHERLPLGLTDADQPAPLVADEIEHGTTGAGSVAGLGAGAGSGLSGERDTGLNAELDSAPGTASDTGAPFHDALSGAHDDVARSGDGGPSHAADASAASVPPAVTSGTGAPNFGALKLDFDFDLELTPNAAAPGSSPTSHDLAMIARNKLDLAAEYIDLGDRAGARTLLNEVLATQDPATRERAQALLATLA